MNYRKLDELLQNNEPDLEPAIDLRLNGLIFGEMSPNRRTFGDFNRFPKASSKTYVPIRQFKKLLFNQPVSAASPSGSDFVEPPVPSVSNATKEEVKTEVQKETEIQQNVVHEHIAAQNVAISQLEQSNTYTVEQLTQLEHNLTNLANYNTRYDQTVVNKLEQKIEAVQSENKRELQKEIRDARKEFKDFIES